MSRVKFRRICKESSEQNGTCICETICPKMVLFVNLAFQMFFQNISSIQIPPFQKFNFYDVTTLDLNTCMYSRFSHEVTAAMVVPLNKEMAAIFVSRPNPLLLRKRILLFSLKNMAVDHVIENQQ